MYYSESYEAGSLEALAKITGQGHIERGGWGEPEIRYICDEEIELSPSAVHKVEKEALEWALHFDKAQRECEDYEKQCRGF